MNYDDQLIEIPGVLPMVPVRDLVFFPHMILRIQVGRVPSIRAVEEALTKNRLIFLATQKEIYEENPTEETIHRIGTIVRIMRMRRLEDGKADILVQGICRGRLGKYHQVSPCFFVDVEKIEDRSSKEANIESLALLRNCKEHLEKIIALGKPISPDILLLLDDVPEPGRFADLVASNIGLSIHTAQRVLEVLDQVERLKMVNEILQNELEVVQMQMRIRNTAKDEMTRSQREYFLREQMRAIKNELGESDSKSEEIDEIREKILAHKMPQEIESEALKQLGRLERMHPDASEASMVRTYLDWLIELPWTKSTEDNLDIDRGQRILDEDHYDLHKVKDRILEFLAVRKLKKTIKGPILCFVGPPGVGKTSLGKSIARSMQRQYVRIALGGMKDEAEIRGHRRTYVGAMPGKIVHAIKQAKTNNPVIVLDEIDKLGNDFRGDPSAAMLEVLDPEQNSTFRDNYLNVDFDLSNILFIATANVLENVPPALRDRMEVISIAGYTETDKVLIARQHLIDKQLEENGVSKDNVQFTDDGLSYLISHYTREAGLRNLNREIGSICRKIAKRVVTGKPEQVIVTPDQITELLGPPRFLRDEKMKENQVGITTGLAWTQAGGEVLYVEALKMKGKRNFVLTGQMGEVMKESAQAAMSYARAHSQNLGISEKWCEYNEVHVHIPAGAIPKDGPSAGITIATSIISLMTEIPVRHDIAMTGEVTLAGRVLPIGGVREKALAALTFGIKNIILPLANKKDLQDIPKDLASQLKFIFVETLDEVLAIALDKKPGKLRKIPAKIKKIKHPTAQSAA